MRYGAMNFPVRPVLDEISSIGRLGMDYLELAMDPPMAHYSTLSAIQADIVRALEDNGLDLVCHLPTFVTTADLTESLRRASAAEMRRSLYVAADLGTKKVVLHPSVVTGMGGFMLDVVKGYAFEFLAEIIRTAEQADVTICLENMMPRNMLGVEAADFDELLKTFPELKLTLDTGHANIDDPHNNRLHELARRFGHHIGHLHFSDNRGIRDEHLPIGQGTVDFCRLIHQMKAIGYDDTLTLEIFDDNRQTLVDGRKRIETLLQE